MPTRRSNPKGFTLLEMLIVLAILSALATMAWPALRKELSRSQLRSAAKQVRMELAAARHGAVETGQMIEFRYQVDGRHFRTDAVQLPRMDGLADDFAETDSDRGPGRFDDPSEPSARQEGTLPEGTFFLPINQDPSGRAGLDEPFDRSPTREPLSRQGSSGAATASPDDGRTGQARDPLSVSDDRMWSAPILFFPNGQTSPARIRVGNERGTVVDVTLRALTGMATLGEFRRPKVER